MKILVLGASGMLGHRLLWGLDELGYKVLAGLRTDLSAQPPFDHIPVLSDARRVVAGIDGYDPQGLKRRLTEIRPDVILNCIGVIKQLDEGHSNVPCTALNALLPHLLEDIVADWGGWLIHFSTDCVFKGDRGGYTEADEPDARDLYGMTKALGEVTGLHALTLRTSIIGRELRNHRSLVDWFLSQDGQVVNGYSRAIYSGLTTREMVHVIDCLLRDHHGLNGLYHVASDPISKFDLLGLIRDAAGLKIHIERDDQTVQLDRSLNAQIFNSVTQYHAPTWESMIEELAKDIQIYRDRFGIGLI